MCFSRVKNKNLKSFKDGFHLALASGNVVAVDVS